VKIKYAPSKAKVKGLVRKYVEDVKGKIGLKLAVLFGSYAKNSYSWGSDVDIFLVAEKLPERILERPQMLIDSSFPLPMEVFAYTPEEFNKMVRENHPLVNEALRNGEVVYATVEFKKLLMHVAAKTWKINF
jgi:predicted nucleotidyltransferase